MMPITELYDAIRILIGDTNPEKVYTHQDADLLVAVQTVFRMGDAPEEYVLSSNRESISPALADGRDFAKVVLQAGFLLVGGEDGAYSYRTRALSVTKRGDRRKSLLNELKLKLYEIDGGGNSFAGYQDFISWLISESQRYHPYYGKGKVVEG